MTDITVTVGSTIGLHARPARVIASAAQDCPAQVVLSYNGHRVLATSPLMIMSLGAEHGAEVTVSSADEAATARIAALIEQNLDSA